MKNNTFKRVLAGSLALLTVAAYVPANVGGILPDLSIVASAISIAPIGDADHETFYNEVPNTTDSSAANYDKNQNDINYVQAGGTLKVDSDTTAFIDGVYEITRDAGKYVYTKVGTGTTDLADGKAYVLRTTAYVAEVAGGLTMLDKKDLNGDDLPEGVYEYTIQSVAKTATVMVTTLKTTIQADAAGAAKFAEQLTVTQNGQEIIYDNAKTGYVVAQGFPVEIVANPGEIHTNDMMKVSSGNAVVKSQTRSDSTITLTIVPDKGVTAGGSLTTIQWNSYAPTLQLINEKGTIKATDVGFEQLISNEVVGTYEFRFGSGSNFKDGEVNAKGEYIADGASYAAPQFKQQTVKVNGTSYTFVEEGVTKYEVKDAQGNWVAWSKEASDTITTPYKPGEYRAKTPITATVSGGATLSGTFEIVTEFKIVAQNVTSTKNLLFIAPNDGNTGLQLIQDKNGVYNVPWQNGTEIEPNIILYKDAAKAAAVENTNTAVTAEVKKEKDDKTNATDNNDGTNPSGDYYLEDSKLDYTVTGTTKASEPGTYTMTITPTSKSVFNDGEEITITWQIVNTNNYVTSKKATTKTEKSKVTASQNATDVATANAQSFTIGYRQASSKTILQNIIKSLDFVGNTDLTVVEYKAVTKWEVTEGTGSDSDKFIATATEGAVVDDPSEKAGYYVAYVANALKNDGKTSAMMKDNDTYNGGKLYPVYFQVTPTKVRIVPQVTEITYGDDVEISKLYTVIDGDTKEKIGVPWGNAPIFQLTGKYGETTQDTNGKVSTKDLAAGEYTYKVSNTGDVVNKVSVLDPDNYDVSQLLSEDKIDFTVNPRDLSEMDFGAVNVKVPDGEKYVNVTKLILAQAANAIDANPSRFAYTYNEGFILTENNYGTLEEIMHRKDAVGFSIAGGTTSAKATALGQTFTVNIKGTGNFTGTKAVKWIVGDNVLSDKVMSYEAEFDAAKPRVMAKFDITKVDGEIEECGFYYNNNGKMNDVPLYGTTAADTLRQADATGTNANQKGCKKVGFSATALAKAQSGNGLLTAEIANSSVLKQVYIMPYVKYTNGNVAYGDVEKFNYYDMVLNAEGALEVTKTDFVGDGKTGTEGQTYVKVDVTRVDKKGYEVERYGIVYNNSDAWNTAGTGAKDGLFDDQELVKAYTWLNLDYESEKTVKVAEVPAKDLATKIGTNTYIANTTKKDVNATTGKVTKDYGYGAKSVFAKAFIKIKDAAGNEKVYYSHLADVTYGGFTVDAATGKINGTSGTANLTIANVENNTAVVDSKNTTQIVFFAPAIAYDDYELDKDGVEILDTAHYEASNEGAKTDLTRMAASTGNKTFQVWWQDQKNS